MRDLFDPAQFDYAKAAPPPLFYEAGWGVPPSGVAGQGFGTVGTNLPQNPLADKGRVNRILSENADKNFVQRIMNPSAFPAIMRPDIGPDVRSTHLMAWGVDEKTGKNIVYPTITQDPTSKALKWWNTPDLRSGSRAAMQDALKTGEYIAFKTPEEAAWFSEHYKLGAGK